MKFIILVFLAVKILTSDLPGQSANKEILDTAVKFEVFLSNFYICESAFDTIFIHDENKYFDEIEYEVCDIIVILTHEPSNYHPSTISLLSSVDHNRIELYRLDHLDKNNYKLYFWKPISGAALKLFIEKSNEDFYVYEYWEGAF